MSVLILASIAIQITSVICKIDLRGAEEASELPEIKQIVNFLDKIQNKVNGGRFIIHNNFEINPGPDNHTEKPLEHTTRAIIFNFATTTMSPFNDSVFDYTVEASPPPPVDYVTDTPPLEPSPGEPEFYPVPSSAPSDYNSVPPDYDTTLAPNPGFDVTPQAEQSPIEPELNGTQNPSSNPQEMPYVSKDYFTNGLEHFVDIIIQKHPEHVMAVIRNSEMLFNAMLSSGRFQWLGDPLKKVVLNIVTAFSRLSHKHLRGAMQQFHYELVNRHSIYSPETNIVFDSVNNIIDHKDAQEIYAVLQEFQHFTEVNKTGNEMCRNIIDAFEMPFVRILDSDELTSLINAANIALQQRFPVIERRFGPSISELQMSSKSQKRNATLSYVDIFFGRHQGTNKQSNLKNEELYHKQFPENSTESRSPVNFTFDSSKKTFMRMIEEQGWIASAWQKFWKQVLFKKAENVAAVTKHLKSTLNEKLGDMNWLQGALKVFIMDTVSAVSDMPVNFLKHSSRGVYNDIKFRQKMLSPEVNEIIDFANNMVSDKDGFLIFRALKNFEQFPKEGPQYLSGVEICRELIEAFARPFQSRTEETQKLKKMIDRIQGRLKYLERNQKDNLRAHRMKKSKKPILIQPKKHENHSNQNRPRLNRTKRSLPILRKPTRLIIFPNNPKMSPRLPKIGSDGPALRSTSLFDINPYIFSFETYPIHTTSSQYKEHTNTYFLN